MWPFAGIMDSIRVGARAVEIGKARFDRRTLARAHAHYSARGRTWGLAVASHEHEVRAASLLWVWFMQFSNAHAHA